ncbi:hypothetical protein I7I53_02332 [Histoplasma capsulatum var. duboisii H88]|uniref:Uncharacterized protein n=1 Tax=Ajellomyces capsulatus (strain H88) TaxID=544711 RepID=A0A8A1LQ28_AJEC8|nr:hypothetical protein I7I53_02332 [Histoplasma capsulatum var. duboisii H88]
MSIKKLLSTKRPILVLHLLLVLTTYHYTKEVWKRLSQRVILGGRVPVVTFDKKYSKFCTEGHTGKKKKKKEKNSLFNKTK